MSGKTFPLLFLGKQLQQPRKSDVKEQNVNRNKNEA